MYEPVSAGTLLSHKDAKVSHAGNNPVTLHADVLREILNLLGLERVTFGLRGKDLTLGSMQGRPVAVLQEFGRHAAPFEILGEEAMHEQIRVATDGRGKVRVVLEGESKVPDIFHRVNCLCHGAQCCRVHKVLLWCSQHLDEESVELGRIYLLAP